MPTVPYAALVRALRDYYPVLLDGPNTPDARLALHGVNLPEAAVLGEVAWLRAGRELEGRFDGSVLLVDRIADVPVDIAEHARVIGVDDPRAAMAAVIRSCFPGLRGEAEIHPSAFVHPSAVLGPFGQSRTGDGASFPQVGGLLVEAFAEVGPMATVMYAAIGTTRIGPFVSIGNGVNIGHGCQIGARTLIAAHASLGGSVRVGPDAFIWQGANIAHGVRIGAGAVVAMGAAVTRDVPAGQTWGGVPARRLR